jgi:myo-inositol-1(or 4)-monophosphatase
MENPLDLGNCLTFAVQLAREAGEILKEAFGTHFKIESKDGKHDLVTEFDKKVEAFLKQKIHGLYKDHEILAEESAKAGFKTDKPCWIIDPIDGTVNFAHEIPVFAISIGFAIKGVVQIGVVYHPMANELFTAQKGHGAYLNGKKLTTSPTNAIKKAMLATGFPYNLEQNPDHCIEHLTQILKMGIPIRRMGSAAIDMAYVAAGRFDGFWEISLKPWDFAAGLLLVKEAGGKVATMEGDPLNIFNATSVVASNHHLYEAILEHLKLSKDKSMR